MTHLPQIVKEAVTYVNTYISHATGITPLHPRQLARQYGFSTLPYFHDILGIATPGLTDTETTEKTDAFILSKVKILRYS